MTGNQADNRRGETMAMAWIDIYVPTSSYLMVYGFFAGSVAWKTTVYAGMVWASRAGARRAIKKGWRKATKMANLSFKDSRTWMGIVIAAMLITFPLGGITNYFLALEQFYESNKTNPNVSWGFMPEWKFDQMFAECRNAGKCVY
jgi:Na+/H+-translocating membrane pyrophosphatase